MSCHQQTRHDTTFTISVLLYGRTSRENDNDDVPCHVGIAIHANVSEPETCSLHHARCPDQVRFIYEHRPEQPYCTDPILRGRCELFTAISKTDADRANDTLALFGAEQAHLPFFGAGNCQNWMAGAIAMLEQEHLAHAEDGQHWTQVIGKGRLTMEHAWKARGRRWVDNPKSLQAGPEIVDARWSDKEEREVGKLNDNERFTSHATVLQAFLQKGPLEKQN